MKKLVLAGFPCQHFSIAQKKSRINKVEFTANDFIKFHNSYNDWYKKIEVFEKEIGQRLSIENYKFDIGLQLFFNCICAIDKMKKEYPDDEIYYLLENVASMQKEVKEVLTSILGELYGGICTEINSALVSAQKRKRIYFTNFGEIPQPEDEGILLPDILETKNFSNYVNYSNNTMIKESIANIASKKGYVPVMFNPDNKSEITNKSPTLTTGSMVTSSCATMKFEPIKVGSLVRPNGKLSSSQGMRIYSSEAKSVTLTANGGGMGGKTGLYAIPVGALNDDICCKNNVTKMDDNTVYKVINKTIIFKKEPYPIDLEDGYYIIRKLTVNECQKLQTIRDTYEFPVSNAQAYKILGNGWNIKTIEHILSCLFNEKKEETIDVLSLYDGMSGGNLALEHFPNIKINKYVAYEIDKYAIKTALHNFPKISECGNAFDIREENWSYEEK